MEKISINDIIYATAIIRGRIAASVRLSGLKSVADAVAALKSELGAASGLLTITLRNMSQGWCKSKSIYLSPVHVRPAAGIQLTLF